MIMKRAMIAILVLCLLLTGCSSSQGHDAKSSATDTQPVPTRTISPLPDTTKENLVNGILSVSLENSGVCVDDTGTMRMDLTVYTYDRYDMVDIASLAVGDVLVRHAGDVEVTSLERSESGTVYINGGLENGGFDLFTDDSGVYYETGFNDVNMWYATAYVTIRVSEDFVFTDNADPQQGELVFYPGSFLAGEVTNYDFTPYNTTVRVEEGQLVEMNRRYIP